MFSANSDAIVLTGCGWVTPVSAGSIETVLQAGLSHGELSAGDHSYVPVPDGLFAGCSALTAELRGDKTAAMSAVAVELALRTAGLSVGGLVPERTGLVLGCALAGQLGMIRFAEEVRVQGPRFVSPIHFPQTVGNYAAGAVARAFQLRGPNVTVACGAASSMSALTQARELLVRDEADVVLAGGADEFSPAMAAGYAQSAHGSSVLAEGACVFVMERHSSAIARGVAPLATLLPHVGIEPGTKSLSQKPSPYPLPCEGRGDNGIGSKSSLGCAGISPSTVVSSVTVSKSGTIWIEHWIGHCPGAAGAAAVAALIGSCQGQSMPWVDTSVRPWEQEKPQVAIRLSQQTCVTGRCPAITMDVAANHCQARVLA